MWSIIKFDKKNYISFKNEFIKKLGNDTVFYRPKFNLKILNKLKFYSKEVYLLNDYIFVYSKKFKNISILESLKFTKGLKYFLSGFNYSQIEINNFIKKCKNVEDKNGYLSNNFFEIRVSSHRI